MTSLWSVSHLTSCRLNINIFHRNIPFFSQPNRYAVDLSLLYIFKKSFVAESRFIIFTVKICFPSKPRGWLPDLPNAALVLAAFSLSYHVVRLAHVDINYICICKLISFYGYVLWSSMLFLRNKGFKLIALNNRQNSFISIKMCKVVFNPVIACSTF